MSSLSCGIIPIKPVNDSWHFLLLRCYRNWDFPKGMKETKEDPRSCALRELKEETGLNILNWVRPENFYQTPPYSKGKVARYYLAQVLEQEVMLLPNPVTKIYEHHEYRWCEYTAARELLVPRLQLALDWAQNLLKT